MMKADFITIIGVPNVGKSTLTNELARKKISIVSKRVQTTRASIRAILVEDNTQLVFCDTPGIFQKPKKGLEKVIVENAFYHLKASKKIIFVLDIKKIELADNQFILDYLKKMNLPVILVINKIDLVKRKTDLLDVVNDLSKEYNFEQVFFISAENNDGVDDLRKYLLKNATESPFLYPEDQITDAPSQFLCTEITREKLFKSLHNELPYGICVDTEKWQEKADKSIEIHQTIYINKESYKKIIVGRQAELIKDINIKAREDMEKLLDKKIHLYLYVKTKEDWVDMPHMYKYMGLH